MQNVLTKNCTSAIKRSKAFHTTLMLLMLIFLSTPNICVSFTISKVLGVEKLLEDKNSSEIKSTFPFPLLTSKTLLGALKWRYTASNLYMAHCSSEEDCEAGIRMICNAGLCTCKAGDLFFDWPKYGCFVKAHMFSPCEVSGQCIAMNTNTYCNPENGRCTCSPNFFYNGRECSIRYDGASLKAQEVYKAAVVAAACFIVAVVGIFVACIVRRSFCRREQHLQQSESNRNSDIFSISDEIAALRAVDKPPSYEEVLQIERTFYGIPPPEYSGPRNENILTTLQLPSNCASDQTACLNVCANSEGSHTTVVGGDSDTRPDGNVLKESAEETSLTTNSRDISQLPNPINFVAAAEVLPVPSDIQNNTEPAASLSFPLAGESSHNTCSHIFSSTPPPRLHYKRPKIVHSSSSLPGSPHLSSDSSQFSHPGLNPISVCRKKLLKQSNVSLQSSTSLQSFQDSPSLPHAGNDLSMPDESSTNAICHSDSGSNLPATAYDNLGFVSDLHI